MCYFSRCSIKLNRFWHSKVTVYIMVDFFYLSKPVRLTSVAVIIFSNFLQLIAWILNPNTLNYSTDYNKNAIFANFYSLQAIKTSKTVLRRYLSAHAIKVMLLNGFFFHSTTLVDIFFLSFLWIFGPSISFVRKIFRFVFFLADLHHVVDSNWMFGKENKAARHQRVKNLKNNTRRKKWCVRLFLFSSPAQYAVMIFNGRLRYVLTKLLFLHAIHRMFTVQRSYF